MGNENNGTVILGGNIELNGFNDIDGASLIIVKKMVGSYTKKISEKLKGFQKISVTLKDLEDKSYSIEARVHDQGKDIAEEDTEPNLFFALDKVLKKVEATSIG